VSTRAGSGTTIHSGFRPVRRRALRIVMTPGPSGKPNSPLTPQQNLPPLRSICPSLLHNDPSTRYLHNPRAFVTEHGTPYNLVADPLRVLDACESLALGVGDYRGEGERAD